MDIPNDSLVYCDANFLVAYGSKETKQIKVQKNAQILFAKLLVNNCRIVASPLTFDEAWNGIRKEAGLKTKNNFQRLHYKIDNLLQKCGIRFVRSVAPGYSYNDVMPTLKEFTSKLLLSSKFQIAQFPVLTEKDGITGALNNIEKFGMRPRDSFHLSMMQKNDVKYIVTRDTDFIKKKFDNVDIITF